MSETRKTIRPDQLQTITTIDDDDIVIIFHEGQFKSVKYSVLKELIGGGGSGEIPTLQQVIEEQGANLVTGEQLQIGLLSNIASLFYAQAGSGSSTPNAYMGAFTAAWTNGTANASAQISGSQVNNGTAELSLQGPVTRIIFPSALQICSGNGLNAYNTFEVGGQVSGEDATAPNHFATYRQLENFDISQKINKIKIQRNSNPDTIQLLLNEGNYFILSGQLPNNSQFLFLPPSPSDGQLVYIENRNLTAFKWTLDPNIFDINDPSIPITQLGSDTKFLKIYYNEVDSKWFIIP